VTFLFAVRQAPRVHIHLLFLQHRGHLSHWLREDLERRMKEVLSLKVQITPVKKGDLDKYTMTSQSSKVKRLLDRRD
jgi:hypothetical protein